MPCNPAPSTSSHRRWWLWWPLLGLGAWLALFGDKTPSTMPDVSQATRPASHGKTIAAPAAHGAAAGDGEQFALVPRDQLVPSSGKGVKPKSAARDLFGARDWNPPPPPPPAVEQAPPPVAPPQPYTFIGKKHEGDSWEAYLIRGEQTFIAREGLVLEGGYRIDKIQPPTLTMTYLPMAQVQTLSIGDAP